MTELGSGVLMTPNDGPSPYGSAGFVLPRMQVRIVDVGTGRDCGVGEEGELWCRGDNVMKGYYKRPDVTRQCIDEQGWFHSGACSVVYMGTSFFYPRIYTRVVWYRSNKTPMEHFYSHLYKYTYVHHNYMYWQKINNVIEI